MYKDVHGSMFREAKKKKGGTRGETTQISIHKKKDKLSAYACSVTKMKTGVIE